MYVGIQQLRGYAALAVVAFHYSLEIDLPKFVGGEAGVDIFFVISGFIMAILSKGTPGRFWMRRFVRVVPLWVMCLTCWLVLYEPRMETCRTAASFLLLVDCKPYLPPGWTLAYEMMFYSLVALGISRPKFAIVAFVAIAIFRPLMFEFAMGWALLYIPRKYSAWGFLAVPVLLLTPTPEGYGFERLFVWGLPSMAIVWAFLGAEKHFSKGIMSYLGDASYSIYLTHMIVLMSTVTWAIPLIFIVGIAVHEWIEKPILKSRLPTSTARAAEILNRKT